MPFRDVIGHRQLVELLSRAVTRGSLPPSLIFGGPGGVGKTTTAVALAQALNCDRLPATAGDGLVDPADACGACATCRRIARAGRAFRERAERPAIDCLQWLSPDDKGSIKLDAVREVLKRAGYRPLDGRSRVVVIEEADALEIGAQQALLKALEEPPPPTRFVLATSRPDALLPTIRSRCPQLRFGPLPAAEIARVLVEGHGWDASDAQAAAALSDGRLGVALETGMSARRAARAVAADVLAQVARSREPVQRLEAAQVMAQRSAASGGARDRGKTVSRQELSARLEAMGALLRDIGVIVTRADQRRLANPDLSPLLGDMARAFDGDRVVRAFTAVDRARQALDRNAGQKVVSDWLVLHL